MKDLFFGVHVVIKTLNLEISRYRLRRLRQKILLKCVPSVQHDYLFSFNRSKGRFSKDPITYRARKAILKAMTRLPRKAALLICLRCEERRKHCQVSKLETCSYWRYKGIYIIRKVSGCSRNGPQIIVFWRCVCQWYHACLNSLINCMRRLLGAGEYTWTDM